jgi:hypothetical protein
MGFKFGRYFSPILCNYFIRVIRKLAMNYFEVVNANNVKNVFCIKGQQRQRHQDCLNSGGGG